jgi:hypothetical protein
MVYGISNPNVAPGMQGESMAASSAMVVTGLEKELKNTRVRVDFADTRISLKQIEEYIQKLTDTTAIDKVKKYDERRQHKGKKEEEQPRRKLSTIAPSSRPAQPFEWIDVGKPAGLWDLLLHWESRVLREILKYVLQPNLEELVSLARDLNIDLTKWKLDKISINHRGEILLDSGLSLEEKLRILLLDECKILEIGKLLEESWVKLAVINLRLLRVKSTLKELGIKEEEFEAIKLAARRIAFLKLIAQLKEMHLKRVFSTSRKEFSLYSKFISQLTHKAWKIEVDLPKEGMKWIHERLETLAKESARYKLELLRSLQQIGFEAEREKTVRWLEHTAAKLG